MNIDAVNDRYGEGSAPTFRDLDYYYGLAYASEIQVLKSLQCWLYQCTEGEVVKRSLYRFFDTVVEHHLLSNIVSSLPAYEAAEWG